MVLLFSPPTYLLYMIHMTLCNSYASVTLTIPFPRRELYLPGLVKSAEAMFVLDKLLKKVRFEINFYPLFFPNQTEAERAIHRNATIDDLIFKHYRKTVNAILTVFDT